MFDLIENVGGRCICDLLSFKAFIRFSDKELLQFTEEVVVVPNQVNSLLFDLNGNLRQFTFIFLFFESHILNFELINACQLYLTCEVLYHFIHLLEKLWVATIREFTDKVTVFFELLFSLLN